MGRFLPLLLLLLTSMAAMAAATNWVVFPNVERDSHVQSLGGYAVAKQNNPYLNFIKVVHAEMLDRGTQHYTYKLVICLVEGTRTTYYSCEILQDLGAPNQPPVLNIASFKPIPDPTPYQNWVTIPTDQHAWNLCAFAVRRYNTQNHASLRLVRVVSAQVLDRGTQHFTYHFTVKLLDNHVGVKIYKIEVFQDLSAPGQPPVLNLGYFQAL